MRLTSRFAVLLSAALLFDSSAQAQLFRAYLSGQGSDTDPCTAQQPCRLLPATLNALASGGEIWMVDSASFNTAPVLVTKSVSILAIPGAPASIFANGGNALLIDAPGIRVSLRNLKVLNFSAGQNGIHMANGAALKFADCEVAGFTGMAGIKVNAPAKATVVDTTVRDGDVGIWFDRCSTTGSTRRARSRPPPRGSRA